MTGVRCRRALIIVPLVAAHLVLAGCRPATDGSVEAATATAAHSSPGPGALFGDWSSSTPTTEIAYRFLPDGRYRSVEILSYQQPRGLFQFQRVQDGTASVDGDHLRLSPSRSVRSRVNPEDPAGDYADRPEKPTVRTVTWHVDASTLTLRGDDGNEIVLSRQS